MLIIKVQRSYQLYLERGGGGGAVLFHGWGGGEVWGTEGIGPGGRMEGHYPRESWERLPLVINSEVTFVGHACSTDG